jgi:hypothetical protein
MWSKFKEIINPLVQMIDDNFGITFELVLFASNIKREMQYVLSFFLF